MDTRGRLDRNNHNRDDAFPNVNYTEYGGRSELLDKPEAMILITITPAISANKPTKKHPLAFANGRSQGGSPV
jgi:hypothetical protein